MKKGFKIIIFFCLTLLCLACISCNNKVSFEDIIITGEDISGLEEGAYTLRFNIKNLEEYQKKNNAELTVVVTDKNNNNVPLTSNRIIQIEKDNYYLVTIMVSADNGTKIKTHSFTVSAIRNPIMVTFTSDYKNFENIIKIVPYGDSLTDIPEVPDYTPQPVTGYTTIVSNKRWSHQDFNNIKENIVVKALYDIDMPANQYTITYQTYGGTQIPENSVYYDHYITEPEPPIKTDCVFYGWYTDEDLTEKYSFGVMGPSNITLHAKWLEPLQDATDYTYFTFSINDYDNNYAISANNKSEMPETIIIPNMYNGKAVTKLGDFSQCETIKHIYIPETINSFKTYAVSGKNTANDNIAEMSLQKITFDENIKLETISKHAFSYCPNLTIINIPETIKTIGESAFEGCTGLTSVLFSENSKLQNIQKQAFYNCSYLSSLSIPEKVNSLAEMSFYNCISLEQITMLCSIPPNLQSNVFYFEENQNSEPLEIKFIVLENSMQLYEHHAIFSSYTLETKI